MSHNSLLTIAHDRFGERLVTRVYFGDNYGKDDEGHPLKLRQFVEVIFSTGYSYFNMIQKDAIWLVVSQIPGNTHLRRDQLFEDTDAYYSLTQVFIVYPLNVCFYHKMAKKKHNF